VSNIEPLARDLCERVCRQSEVLNPSNPPMTPEQVAAWVDARWECVAAELEAGMLDDDGAPIPGASWQLGLAAYRERMGARKQREKARS
jgi:hypothetical protein